MTPTTLLTVWMLVVPAGGHRVSCVQQVQQVQKVVAQPVVQQVAQYQTVVPAAVITYQLQPQNQVEPRLRQLEEIAAQNPTLQGLHNMSYEAKRP